MTNVARHSIIDAIGAEAVAVEQRSGNLASLLAGAYFDDSVATLERAVVRTHASTHGSANTSLILTACSMLVHCQAAQLYDPKSKTAMSHEALASAWYAVGLLARNGNDGEDMCRAESIISYIIADQQDNAADLWYGDYIREPGEPDVGSGAYPARPYRSWNPNWRGFVGLSFITMYEDFGDLLSEGSKDLMLESLVNCSIGDSYREGGVNGDNLYPAYSNAAIMHAIGTGWAGRMRT